MVQIQQLGGVVTVTGSSADESVTIKKVEGATTPSYLLSGAKFSLNGAEAKDNVTIQQDSFVSLSVNLGQGNDVLSLDSVSASFLSISDGQGPSNELTSITLKGGEYTSVSINIDSGRGILEMKPSSSNGLQVLGDVKVKLTNTLSSMVSFLSENSSGPSKINGAIVVDSSAAPDSVDNFSIDARGSGQLKMGGVNLILGNMDDTVSLAGAITVSGNTTLNTGSGNDIAAVSASNGVPNFNNLQVRMSDGDDRLLIDSPSRLTNEGTALFDVGAGNDQVSVRNVDFSKTLGIALGSGENALQLQSVKVTETTKVTTTESGMASVVIAGSLKFSKPVSLQLGGGSVSVLVGSFADAFEGKLTVKGLSRRPVVHLNVDNPGRSKLVLVKADLG